MTKRNPSIKRKTKKSGRGGSLTYLLITVLCAVLVMAGFFLVAVQHFATVELGIKNSELRSQVEELEAEKRRLLLARETALSPAELARTAKRLGFVERELESTEAPVLAVAAKPETETTRTSAEPTVERIVYSKPVADTPRAAERDRKAIDAAKPEQKPKTTVAAIEKKMTVAEPSRSEGRPRRVTESAPKTTLTAAARLK